MKHLLKKDIEGATFGRIIADATSVKMKGFDFDFIKPYELVDLGIGTLWMDRNIGAASPEDAGLYFAWGETKGYTAEQCGAGEGQRTFTADNHQFTDTPEVLPAENDAATAFDPELRMPTMAEVEALWRLRWDEVYSSDGSDRVFLGVRFNGTNGNTLFVPAAGRCVGGAIEGSDTHSFLWSSSTYPGYPQYTVSSHYDNISHSSGVSYNAASFNGCPVRGVVGK